LKNAQTYPEALPVSERARSEAATTLAEHSILLAFYTAAALLLTWPLPLNFLSSYPATPGEGAQDLWQNLWNLWWAGAALHRGVNPFFTDVLFYPRGASLLFHPLNLTAGLLSIPLRWLAGPVFAYNALVVLSFVLSGYAVFLLAREQGCGRAAGLAGGLAYTASAFHIAHLRLGHLEQVGMQWLPIYVLALSLLWRRPSIGRGVGVALALLALVFTSLYMALYAALLTAFWVLWKVAASRSGGLRSAVAPLLSLAGALALAIAVVGPVLLAPMAREARKETYMQRSLADAAQGSAAPADALLPPATHPLRALLTLPSPGSLGGFLGFVPLALALAALIIRPHLAALWLALALMAWLLSLGPSLPFYRALYLLPPVQAARYPDRFAIVMILGVAVAAAIGADALLGRLGGASRRAGAAIVLGLLLFELHPRGLPLTEPVDNPFYHQLAREPERWSVFELPINRFNNIWVDMAAQTIHEKPILYGALARNVPRIPLEWLPLIRELEHPDQPADIVVQPPAARLAALRFFGLRYLIYHRADENGPVVPPTAGALSRVARVPIEQVYSDDALVAFRLGVPEGPAALPPFAVLGDGWYPLEPSGAASHRWLRGAAGAVQVYAPAAANVRLRLRLEAYHQSRHLDILVDGRSVGRVEAHAWPAELRTPPFALSEGTHTIQLAPVEPGTTPSSIGAGDDARPLTVAVFEMEIEADG
jgi:hypothetical protein